MDKELPNYSQKGAKLLDEVKDFDVKQSFRSALGDSIDENDLPEPYKSWMKSGNVPSKYKRRSVE